MSPVFPDSIASACPEAASALTALSKLGEEDALDSDEKILRYLTGTAMKYFDVLEIERRRIPVIPRNADSLN